MFKKLSFFAIILAVIATTSCKKNLPDVGGTAAQSVANEWWVMLTDTAGNDLYSIGHFKIATYNTSANNNQIWVDDLGNGYVFKVKANADFGSLSFAAAASANEYYDPAHPTAAPATVTITNGRVLTGAGKSKSGNVADSIMMRVEFSDDPGTIYMMNGHSRTRFIEDEY